MDIAAQVDTFLGLIIGELKESSPGFYDKALAKEGIPVLKLPVPKKDNEDLN